MSPVRIAIVGDFDRGKHSHWATDAALFHAASRLGIAVEPHWVPTPPLATAEGLRELARYHGIWASPGSPYSSMAGMLNAIEYARTHDVAFLGTCGGFQYALIEFTRNVLGIPGADSAENDPGGENIVITPLWCETPLHPHSPRGAVLPRTGRSEFRYVTSAAISRSLRSSVGIRIPAGDAPRDSGLASGSARNFATRSAS